MPNTQGRAGGTDLVGGDAQIKRLVTGGRKALLRPADRSGGLTDGKTELAALTMRKVLRIVGSYRYRTLRVAT